MICLPDWEHWYGSAASQVYPCNRQVCATWRAVVTALGATEHHHP